MLPAVLVEEEHPVLGPGLADPHEHELLPNAYTPPTVGITVLTVGASINDGSVAFDPTLPVTDGHATIAAMFGGVNRTLSVAGRSAAGPMPFLQ